MYIFISGPPTRKAFGQRLQALVGCRAVVLYEQALPPWRHPHVHIALPGGIPVYQTCPTCVYFVRAANEYHAEAEALGVLGKSGRILARF